MLVWAQKHMSWLLCFARLLYMLACQVTHVTALNLVSTQLQICWQLAGDEMHLVNSLLSIVFLAQVLCGVGCLCAC